MDRMVSAFSQLSHRPWNQTRSADPYLDGLRLWIAGPAGLSSGYGDTDGAGGSYSAWHAPAGSGMSATNMARGVEPWPAKTCRAVCATRCPTGFRRSQPGRRRAHAGDRQPTSGTHRSRPGGSAAVPRSPRGVRPWPSRRPPGGPSACGTDAGRPAEWRTGAASGCRWARAHRRRIGRYTSVQPSRTHAASHWHRADTHAQRHQHGTADANAHAHDTHAHGHTHPHGHRHHARARTQPKLISTSARRWRRVNDGEKRRHHNWQRQFTSRRQAAGHHDRRPYPRAGNADEPALTHRLRGPGGEGPGQPEDDQSKRR